MNNIRKNLLKGESVVMETETAGLSYTSWRVSLLAVIIFSFNISSDFGFKLILISAFILCIVKYVVGNQELVLTDKRIIYCNGRGTIEEIGIDDIETIRIICNNGLQGNFEIIDSGSKVIKTHWITDPITFKVAVSRQIQINKSRV